MMNLSNWTRGTAAGTLALLLMIGTPASAADNPQVAAEIMALARAQWASEIAGEAMLSRTASWPMIIRVQRRLPDLIVGKAMPANGRRHAQR